MTGVLTLVAVFAGLGGGGIAGWRGWRRGVDRGGLLAGVVAAGGIVLAAFVVLAPGPIDMFGLLHLAYLGVVVSLPMVGATVLLVPRLRPPSRLVAVAAVGLVLPAPFGAYVTHVEPYWLRTDRVQVAVDPARAGDDPVRIAVMADFQAHRVGGRERAAITRLLAFHADLILLPGDLFQGNDVDFRRQLPALRAQLARLRAPAGVFYVRGDSEPDSRVPLILAGTHVRVLDDRAVDLRVGDRLLRVGGTRLRWTSPAAAAVRARLADGPEDGSIRILLSHRPDTVLPLPAHSRVDLTVAGHTHGGQIVVPGFGPLITISAVPRTVARGGLHAIAGNPIYVSPGVGLERGQAPQVRFLSRPAVTLLTLADAP